MLYDEYAFFQICNGCDRWIMAAAFSIAPNSSATKPNFALPPVSRLLNAQDVTRRAQYRSGVEAVGGHFAGDVVEEGTQVAARLGRG